MVAGGHSSGVGAPGGLSPPAGAGRCRADPAPAPGLDHQEVSQSYSIVKAIDHAHSEAERDDDGALLCFNKTWFLQSAPGIGQIAREPESGDLLISATLADRLIDAGFKSDKGLGLYSAERRFVPYRNNA